jgi:hypothetical protein
VTGIRCRYLVSQRLRERVWLASDWNVLSVRLDARSSSEFAIEHSSALPRRIMEDGEHCSIGAGIGIADTKTCQVLEKVFAWMGRRGRSPESVWQEIRVSFRLGLPVEV